MIEFEKELELMHVEERTRKDGNGKYVVVTVLTEEGKTIDLKYDGIPVDWSKYKKRVMYLMRLKFVQTSKFSYCNVIEILAV